MGNSPDIEVLPYVRGYERKDIYEELGDFDLKAAMPIP